MSPMGNRGNPMQSGPSPMSPHNGAAGGMGSGGSMIQRSGQSLQQDLAAQLAETLAQASSLIQAAGLAQGVHSVVVVVVLRTDCQVHF